MRKWALVGAGTLAVLVLVAGSTFAYLKASASNSGNEIATGEFALLTKPEPFMRIADLVPGGPRRAADVRIFAEAQTRFVYRVSATKQSGSTNLWKTLMVEVLDLTTGETWTGKLSELETGWLASAKGVGGGGFANGRDVRFGVWLPQDADVAAGSSIVVKYEFEAEQWRSPAK